MLKRITILMFALMFFAVQLLVPQASAASYRDLDGHWAEEYAEALADLGIYANKSGNFYPDQAISRGEALVLLNRVLEKSFGHFSDPNEKVSLDFRYPLAAEVRQAVGNIDKLFYVEQKQFVDFSPGASMLYYLHLSATKGTMLSATKKNADWWVASAHLQQPLNREEASMLIFHALSNKIIDDLDVQPQDVLARYQDFYNWKVPSLYLDTKASYPTLIKEYRIFESPNNYFQPKVKVTRGQYAVVLKRLYDFFETYKRDHFAGSPNQKLQIANLMLSTAAYGYQKQDQSAMKLYFDDKAMDTMKEIFPSPFHSYDGELKLSTEDRPADEIFIIGTYQSPLIGKYQIEYLLKKDENAKNPYGWMINMVQFKQL